MSFWQIRRIIFGISFCLVVSFFLVLSTQWTVAQNYSDLQQKITQKNNDIKTLEAEIRVYENEIDRLGDEKDSLANKIASINLTVKKLSADIQVTEKKIESVQLKIRELSGSIIDTDTSVNVQKNAVAKALRDMKYESDGSFVERILSSSNALEALDRFGALLQLQKAMQEKIGSLENLRSKLSTDKISQELAKSELVELKSELVARKTITDAAKREQQEVLTQTNNKESVYKDMLAEKQRQKKLFEEELFQYESTLEYLLDPSKLPPTGVASLQWPLASIRITQRFGITVDSKRLYKSGTHSGVDFGIPRGTKVYSARRGTVVDTGNTDTQKGCYSYGKWVLIEHDNGLSTLYAHLDLISVAKGQKVSTGDLIAYSGNTGYSTGPHLHFGTYASPAVSVKYGTSKTCGKVAIPVASPQGYLDPLLYLPSL